MIYNRPQDIKLRTLPSLGSLISKGDSAPLRVTTEEKVKADNSINLTKTVDSKTASTVNDAVSSADNYDIILKDKYAPDTNEAPDFFDLTSMPLIEGIPILTLPNEEIPTVISNKDEYKPEFTEYPSISKNNIEVTDDKNTSSQAETIDLEEISIGEDIPMLDLSASADTKKPSTPPFKEAKKQNKKKTKHEKKQLFSDRTTHHGRRLKIAMFFITLYFGTVVAFIIPIRPTYSESEKRELTPFPDFSIDALISGDYFDDISTWFSDTFPYREQLTQVSTYIKSFYGVETVSVHGDVDTGDEIPDAPIVVPDEPIEIPNDPQDGIDTPVTPPIDASPEDKTEVEVQQLGAIVVAGDSAYEYYGYSEQAAIGFVSCVNKLKALANPTGNVYTMIIPTSMDITLDDDIREQISNTADQKAAIDLFNKSFKNCICVDGIYDAQRAHRNEYTYFRTDHHWTALGAYYAYEQFAKEKGIAPIPLASYPVKHFDGFLGTFYSSSGQNPALKENPDTVTAYLPINDVDCSFITHMGDTALSWPVINDVTDYSSGMKYLTFIGGDNALTTIVNNDNPDGGICIVIKDSYGNAFVPFLIPHYNTVYVIDPRYYTGSLSGFCADKEIEDVIFLLNISATRNFIYLEGLQNLTR